MYYEPCRLIVANGLMYEGLHRLKYHRGGGFGNDTTLLCIWNLPADFKYVFFENFCDKFEANFTCVLDPLLRQNLLLYSKSVIL